MRHRDSHGSCSTGNQHSACLSKDGLVHTWGNNDKGQLGLGNNKSFTVPQQVPNLHNILSLACGTHFTICVDIYGNLWSFGENSFGQLGIGNTTNQNSPQKVLNIPSMSFVSCGHTHTLCISNKQELWSFGSNLLGELCLERTNKSEMSPKQSKFNDIVSISCGYNFSMFQTKNGDIYTCGNNEYGNLGIGSQVNQSKPILVPNLPPKIIQFSCGYANSIFLDEKGIVYGCGYSKAVGSSGSNQTTKVIKIPKIPKIIFIATTCVNTLFVDENKCCWSVGQNNNGQSGTGSASSEPLMIKGLENITNISSTGSQSYHVIATDKTGQIFAFGNNGSGQLGVNDCQNKPTPTKLDAKYSGIIKPRFDDDNICSGVELYSDCNFESLSKIMKWNSHQKAQMIKLHSKINIENQKMKNNKFRKQNQSKPQNSFPSWKKVNEQLIKYMNDSKTCLKQKKQEKQQIETNLNNLGKELKQLKEKIKLIENQIPKEKNKLKQIKDSMDGFNTDYEALAQMQESACLFVDNENQMELELDKLFNKNSIEELDVSESCLALWEMDLSHCQPIFEDNQISFSWICELSKINIVPILENVGINQKDIYTLLYFQNYFKKVGYINSTKLEKIDVECAVCDHNTPEETILLLNEYEIPFGKKVENEEWTAPLLLFANLSSIFEVDAFSPEFRTISTNLSKWKKIHNLHMKELRKQVVPKPAQ